MPPALSEVTHAVAFLAGAVFGAVVVLRVLRVALVLLRRERPPPPEDPLL